MSTHGSALAMRRSFTQILLIPMAILGNVVVHNIWHCQRHLGQCHGPPWQFYGCPWQCHVDIWSSHVRPWSDHGNAVGTPWLLVIIRRQWHGDPWSPVEMVWRSKGNSMISAGDALDASMVMASTPMAVPSFPMVFP